MLAIWERMPKDRDNLPEGVKPVCGGENGVACGQLVAGGMSGDTHGGPPVSIADSYTNEFDMGSERYVGYTVKGQNTERCLCEVAASGRNVYNMTEY